MFRRFGKWVLQVCLFSRLVRVVSYVLISIALDAGRAAAKHGRSFMLHGVSWSGLLLLPLWVVFEHVLVIHGAQDSNVNGPRKLTLNVMRMLIAVFMFCALFGALARCSVVRRTGMIVQMCDAERMWTSEARVSWIKGVFVVCSCFCVSNKFGSLVFRTCWRCLLVNSFVRPFSTCAVCAREVWQEAAFCVAHVCLSDVFFNH